MASGSTVLTSRLPLAARLSLTTRPSATAGLKRAHSSSRRFAMSPAEIGRAAASATEAGSVLTHDKIWQRTCDVYESAQKCGAATTTQTSVEVWQESVGEIQVDWVLRLASILKKKPKATPPPPQDAAAAEKKKFFNPFDPPEPELTVGPLSDTHTLILNKFNVVEHHSIVITNEFLPQTDPLHRSDLEAVYRVLGAMPQGGLGFFNCGEHSGRSQPHKHVQIVPLPFTEGQPASAPLAAALMKSAQEAAPLEVVEARNLPFQAFCCKLGPGVTPEQLESGFAALYRAAFSKDPSAATGELSYNWLGCSEFMALVPRTSEKAAGGMLAINALGFAGTLLCRSEDEVEAAKRTGCLNILSEVGAPW